jgi:hypothetical protein
MSTLGQNASVPVYNKLRNISTTPTILSGDENITTTSTFYMTTISATVIVTKQKQSAENDVSRGQVAGLSVSLTAIVTVALSAAVLWYVMRRLRQKPPDTDATRTVTESRTLPNPYLAGPFRKRQTDKSGSDFKVQVKPSSPPSARYGSVVELEHSDMENDDVMVANPAYAEMEAVNERNSRPKEDPVYEETCY